MFQRKDLLVYKIFEFSVLILIWYIQYVQAVSLRFIDAAPNTNTLHFYINTNNELAQLNFGQQSRIFQLSPYSISSDVLIRSTFDTYVSVHAKNVINMTISSLQFQLNGDALYSLIAVANNNNININHRSVSGLLLQEPILKRGPPDSISVRVVHAAAGLPDLDFYLFRTPPPPPAKAKGGPKLSTHQQMSSLTEKQVENLMKRMRAERTYALGEGLDKCETRREDEEDLPVLCLSSGVSAEVHHTAIGPPPPTIITSNVFFDVSFKSSQPVSGQPAVSLPGGSFSLIAALQGRTDSSAIAFTTSHLSLPPGGDYLLNLVTDPLLRTAQLLVVDRKAPTAVVLLNEASGVIVVTGNTWIDPPPPTLTPVTRVRPRKPFPPTAHPFLLTLENPALDPTDEPSPAPTYLPTAPPTARPSRRPTKIPTCVPSPGPTAVPTTEPSTKPTKNPSPKPSRRPTRTPTVRPTRIPTETPTETPTMEPTVEPSLAPTEPPTEQLTIAPSKAKSTRRPSSKSTAKSTSKSTSKSTTKSSS